MKRKHTKRALLSSVLALVLCFSMMLGTTFAWFTDSVESTNNIIKAGNLDIELYYQVEGQTDWTKVTADSNIFMKDALWEPGHTEVVKLKVVNEGTLVLKYQMGVNVAGETTSKSVTGKDLKLSEFIKYGIVEGAQTYTRDQAVAAVDATATNLSAFFNSETIELKPQAEKIVTMVVYMPTSVDNDANYAKGEKIPTINLGINLYATQKDAESDSFGPDYDKEAWVEGMKVYSADDLVAAIAAGEDVVLMNDVTATEVIELNGESKIDLNGNTLAATIIAPNAELTIENGKIEATNPDASAIEINAGALTLNDVDISSARHAVRVDGNVEVVINDGTYKVEPTTAKTLHALNVSGGAKVTVNGGTFIGPKGTMADSGAAVNVQAGSTVTINGGNFSGGKNHTLAAAGTLTVKGGTFDQDPGAYVAEGYEAVANADGTYSVIFPQESFDSLIENAQPGDTVELPAGTYTFPASDLKEGVTLECAEGTVFEGTSKLNVNGATVVGATFSNPAGTAADQTINGTFKDCVFEGKNGLRWCYAGETVVFENCVFSGSVYGVHFDGGANEVIFRNCTFSGFNALGGAITKVTMEGCTFKANGKSSYNGINLWGSTEMTNCTFVFDGTAAYEWVDLCGENKTATFTNCVVTDGTNEKGMETVVGNYGLGNSITINGETVFIVSDDSDVDVLADTVARGATKILLTDGEYDLKGNQKDGLTLIGMGSNVKVANTTQYASGKAVGAIWKAVNLENVTITNTVYTMADGGKATFTNVTFAAGFRNGYGSGVVFNNCTFGSNSEGYALHFQSDAASEGGLITLNGCQFEGGKVHLGSKRAYAFTGCDFAAGTDFQVWSTITLENCTVDGEKVTAGNIATFFPDLNLEKVTLK